ncbi:MAG: TraK family protein [Planctomycetota bacterium]|jgi:hypothetical protein|nr:TraK family protein [Planctomycetota bacterium]
MKKKPLAQMLNEQADLPGVDESIRNFAVFQDRWEEIRDSYAKGWTYKNIWKVLCREGQFSFGYCAFMGYVRKLRHRELLLERENNGAEKDEPLQMKRTLADPGNPSPTKVELPVYGTKRQPGTPGKF